MEIQTVKSNGPKLKILKEGAAHIRISDTYTLYIKKAYYSQEIPANILATNDIERINGNLYQQI